MKILSVAGASGGHIYPALAFLEALKSENAGIDSLLILPSRALKPGLDLRGIRAQYIPSGQLSLSLSRKGLLAALDNIKGFYASLRIILKFKPDAVVGFGSIDSVWLVVLAWFFRIKTVIHEQNVIPGRANKLLAKFADKVAVSFPESKDYFKACGDKLAVTGNPLRPSLKRVDRAEALSFFGLQDANFTVLVMGGSQASSSINRAFIRAAAKVENRERLQVIHLSGKDERALVSAAYESAGIKDKVMDFLSAMEFAYSVADLAVTRAGATTVAELMYFRLPAIICPYPYAHEHQFANAKILEDKGCALVIKESDLNADSLAQSLGRLISEGAELKKMASGFESFNAAGAADRLKKQVLSLN